MQYGLLICMCLAALFRVGEPFGSGAPSAACSSMKPGHAGSAQTGTNPFILDLKGVTTYTPGTAIKVYVAGSQFKGILLQARSKGTPNIVGTWTGTPIYTKVTRCTETADSITHSSDTVKAAGAMFTWNPPSSPKGEVEFVATLAQEKLVWWLNTKSSVITFRSTSSGTGTARTCAGLLTAMVLLALVSR